VAQRLGEPAVQRLQRAREAFQRHGIDASTHPLQSWEGGGVDRLGERAGDRRNGGERP